MKEPPDDGPPHDDDAPSRRTDPITSHEAGAKVPTAKLELMYLDALARHPALTTTEIANLYGMERDSFSPRSCPLIRKRKVIRNGYRMVRNSSGNIRRMVAFSLRRPSDD